MKCPKCQTENSDAAKFRPMRGGSISARTRANPAVHGSCQDCGCHLNITSFHARGEHHVQSYEVAPTPWRRDAEESINMAKVYSLLRDRTIEISGSALISQNSRLAILCNPSGWPLCSAGAGDIVKSGHKTC